jgi:biotin operon repressor
MSLKKYVIIFNRINNLIEKQSTGRPEEMASKLGISKRQLFNYLKDLKELGYEIEYSPVIESYFYLAKD